MGSMALLVEASLVDFVPFVAADDDWANEKVLVIEVPPPWGHS